MLFHQDQDIPISDFKWHSFIHDIDIPEFEAFDFNHRNALVNKDQNLLIICSHIKTVEN